MFNIALSLRATSSALGSLFLTLQHMKKNLILILFICIGFNVNGQDTLPSITVKNMNGRIIVSWMNDYKDSIANISVQRSYDSLRNYSTIGSVLNPQNRENGYTDANAPYNKMYYRVFIAFEGGKYIISNPVRPVKIPPPPVVAADRVDTLQIVPDPVIPETLSSKNASNPIPVKTLPSNPATVTTVTPPVIKPVVTYPSQRIFSGRDQNVIIHLPEAKAKRYLVKFFDEQDSEIFEIKDLNEDYLIVEKVNFMHSGWFRFELYENGMLLEKNRFFIGKDPKSERKQK